MCAVVIVAFFQLSEARAFEASKKQELVALSLWTVKEIR